MEVASSVTTGRASIDPQEYVRARLLPLLPADVAAAMRERKLVIDFSNNLPVDAYFDGDRSTSGELRISVREKLLTSPSARQVFAHEFFHAVHFVLRPEAQEHRWVREGLAELFATMAEGKMPGTAVEQAFRVPETALTGCYYPVRARESFSSELDYQVASLLPGGCDAQKSAGAAVSRAQYGHDFFYFYYVTRECGGDSLFWKLARGTPGIFGWDSIDAILRAEAATNGSISKQAFQCQSFQGSALNFEVARIKNAQGSISDTNRNVHFLYRVSTPAPAARSEMPSRETLANLPPFLPLRFRPDVLIDSSALEATGGDFRIIWVQTRYPNQVSFTAPTKRDANWIQVLIRLM